jgi:hypothetical protein
LVDSTNNVGHFQKVPLLRIILLISMGDPHLSKIRRVLC